MLVPLKQAGLFKDTWGVSKVLPSTDYRAIVNPLPVRLGILIFSWSTLGTALWTKPIQDVLGTLALVAGLVTLVMALIASRRFERTKGSSLKHPVAHGLFILWLLVGIPYHRVESWEVPVGMGILLATLGILLAVAIR